MTLCCSYTTEVIAKKKQICTELKYVELMDPFPRMDRWPSVRRSNCSLTRASAPYVFLIFSLRVWILRCFVFRIDFPKESPRYTKDFSSGATVPSILIERGPLISWLIPKIKNLFLGGAMDNPMEFKLLEIDVTTSYIPDRFSSYDRR